MLADTYRRRLRDLALDQYGLVTTHDADALGIPSVELRKLAQRGGLVRVGQGTYRFEDIPTTGRDELEEAILLVGRGAFLIDTSVLALHDLGLVNPRRIRVGTKVRVRKALPPRIEVVRRRVALSDLTTYEGIPTTTVERAILDSRGLVMSDRLIEATHDAARRGLLTRRQADVVLGELAGGA